MHPSEFSRGRRVGWLGGAALAVTVLLAGCGVSTTPPAAAQPVAPAPAAPPAAPAPKPPAPPFDPTPEADKAAAVDLLGAAGSARAAGDLGIAWELGRQAAAKWPAYSEAQQFVTDVAAQKQAAEVAAEHAAAERAAAEKAATEKAAADAAAAEAASPRGRAAAQRTALLQQLRDAGYTPYVKSIARGSSDDDLYVTVTTSWALLGKPYRLQYARDLWYRWATLHTPDDLLASQISLEMAFPSGSYEGYCGGRVAPLCYVPEI